MGPFFARRLCKWAVLTRPLLQGYNFGGHDAQSIAGGASDGVKRGEFLRRRDGSYTNS